MNQNLCSNCGAAGASVDDGDPEGEIYCSQECQDQHDALGCPHETHNGFRHPLEARRLIECEDVLRSLASWLGAGGYNAPTVDPKVFEEKIRWGVEEAIKDAVRLSTKQGEPA